MRLACAASLTGRNTQSPWRDFAGPSARCVRIFGSRDMAYGFIRTTVQTRSKGHTATGAVCYRLGLAAVSTILGKDGEPRHFDYTRRTGIAATGYAAPPGTDPSWRDPLTWAKRIEAVDRRRNSRQFRDDVVAIPVELVEAGMAEEAVQAYADRLAAEHRTVVHFAIHEPDRGGLNHHAHVLYPGRHVVGVTFAKKRDRQQDNPKPGEPDLITRHKAIWSEICRARDVELDWSSSTPGHHLGPKLCAVKRARLVEESRETIRETIVASKPGAPAPSAWVLQAVAEIATGVKDALTVREMLGRELETALQRPPAPRAVPAPEPFLPEVLPPARSAEVLPPHRNAAEVVPPARIAPEVLPLGRGTPEVLPPLPEAYGIPPPLRTAAKVLPPLRTAPEVLPAVKTAPEVLPTRRETPQVLPRVRRHDVLRPAGGQAEMLPPREVVTRIIADRTQEQHSRETTATLAEVERRLQLQQRQTLAHEQAQAAAKQLGGRVSSRERSKVGRTPAPSGGIQEVADWLLNCACEVLESFGLEPDARPEREASRTSTRADGPTSPAPRPPVAPTLWERYAARWPVDAAGDRAFFEELTGKPPSKALGDLVGRGIDNWRRQLGTLFQEGEAPKPLPRSLVPEDQARAHAALDVADYVGTLPPRYRAQVEQEGIVERSSRRASRSGRRCAIDSLAKRRDRPCKTTRSARRAAPTRSGSTARCTRSAASGSVTGTFSCVIAPCCGMRKERRSSGGCARGFWNTDKLAVPRRARTVRGQRGRGRWRNAPSQPTPDDGGDRDV